MERSIFPSTFTYKPWLIGEGGFSLRVAYQLNNAFEYKLGRSPISLVAFWRGRGLR